MTDELRHLYDCSSALESFNKHYINSNFKELIQEAIIYFKDFGYKDCKFCNPEKRELK